HRLAERLRDPCDHRGPEARDRAGAADRLLVAVDEDLVAGLGVGVARDVGYAASGSVGVDVVGHLGRGLITGQGELAAYAATGSTAAAAVVPDGLARDLAVGRLQ